MASITAALTLAVTPPSGPAGTSYTLTANATSSSGGAISFAAPTSNPPGTAFTAVPNQPAGQAQWTFVF